MFQFVTFCCGRPIDDVKRPEDIRIVEHPGDEYGPTTYGLNAYCCGSLYRDPSDSELLQRLDHARRTAVNVAIRFAFEALHARHEREEEQLGWDADHFRALMGEPEEESAQCDA